MGFEIAGNSVQSAVVDGSLSCAALSLSRSGVHQHSSSDGFFFRSLLPSAGFTVTISTFAYFSLTISCLLLSDSTPYGRRKSQTLHVLYTKKKKLNRNVVSYIFIYLFTFLLPSFTHPHYRIQHHSTFS